MGKKSMTRKHSRSAAASKAARGPRSKKAGSRKGTTVKHASFTDKRALLNEKALRSYEQALKLLHARKFQQALREFQHLLRDFPEERELHERCNRYIQICKRELTSASTTPQTAEERLYAATLALNNGASDEAIQHLAAAEELKADPSQIHYMMALAKADQGDPGSSADHLLRSIELDPDNRYLARHESAFEVLHDNELIQEALEPLAQTSEKQSTK